MEDVKLVFACEAAVFDIDNSIDFYAKLLAEFDDFAADNSSSRHAMSFCITAHHLYDWVWGDFLKKDAVLREKLGNGKKKEDFAKWIGERSVWFTLCQEISNGSKHFLRENHQGIECVESYAEAGYMEDGYQTSYLAIDTGYKGAPLLPLSHVFDAAVKFWRWFFRECGMGESLPESKTQLSDGP